MVTHYTATAAAANFLSAAEFLVLSKRTFVWREVLERSGEVEWIQSELDLFPQLVAVSYDIVLLDTVDLNSDLLALIQEIRFRSPETVIALIVRPGDLEFHTKLLEAGVSDLVMESITEENFAYRLQVLKLQKAKLDAIQRRTHMVHTVSMLTQQFQLTEHPMVFLADSIEALCRNLGLCGTAIVIKQDDTLNLYAGTVTADNRPRFHESRAKVHPYNPLSQVLQSGVSMLIPDVLKHPYYSAIPIIDNPESALILPLRHNGQLMGSLALFAKSNFFSTEDLAPYELIATHLAKAYFNVRHNYDRESDIHSTRQLVHVWQTLSKFDSAKEVLTTLYDRVSEIKDIKQVVIWLLNPQLQSFELTVYSTDSQIDELMQQLFDEGVLDQVMGELDATMAPVIFHERDVTQPRLAALLKLMGAQSLTLIPIVGATLLGGIFFTTFDEKRLAVNDLSFLESIMHAAGQIVERNMIIHSLQEQQSRLESVLRSIHEGIFFVDGQGVVNLCNPQFTELSGIAPSQIVGKNFIKLLRLLADTTETPDSTFEQLTAALDRMLMPSPSKDEYPVLEMWHATLEFPFTVEFSRLEVSPVEVGWIGYLRPREQSTVASTALAMTASNGLQEDLLVYMLGIEHQLSLLTEGYSLVKPQQHLRELGRTEQNLHQGIQLWKNLLEIEKFNANLIQLELEEIDPTAFIEASLSSRIMSNYRGQITVVAKPPRLTAQLDANYMAQALDNIIRFFLYHRHGQAPITINIVPEHHHILINFHERTANLDDAQLASVFDLSQEGLTFTERAVTIAMSLARQIIEGHGGSIRVEQRRSWGLVVDMIVPTTGGTDEEIGDQLEVTAKAASTTHGLDVLILESEKHLLAEQYSVLTANANELMMETELQGTIRTLKLTHVDVVMLEVASPHMNISAVCQAIRAQSNTPIIVIALPEFETACVQALMEGADAYLTVPLDRDKVLAQIKAIAKRKDINARTAAPVQIGELYLDLARRRVYLGNTLIDLTAKQYEILKMLVMHRDQVLTYQEILTGVWGAEYRDEKQYLWVNVSRLRGKLEPTADSPRYIYTQQGVGYIFHEP
ncbi:MAG: winged helix-turn-helix domain-containing protein [Chloroflexi bacterium]|nr:winged helix-turn-helix domain-containing protein [Chloroflexota bacterium]